MTISRVFIYLFLFFFNHGKILETYRVTVTAAEILAFADLCSFFAAVMFKCTQVVLITSPSGVGAGPAEYTSDHYLQ